MDTSLIFIIIKCTLLPIIAVFFTTKWNVFQYISFIPHDYIFEFGLTIYLSILEGIHYKLNCMFKKRQTTIECIFFSNNQQVNIDAIPIFSFTNDVTYINGKIIVSGNAKKLSKSNVLLTLPNWVDVQVDTNQNLISVDNNNVCKIQINSLVNSAEDVIEETSSTFKISLIKNRQLDQDRTLTASPKLDKKFNYQFLYNKFKLN